MYPGVKFVAIVLVVQGIPGNWRCCLTRYVALDFIALHYIALYCIPLDYITIKHYYTKTQLPVLTIWMEISTFYSQIWHRFLEKSGWVPHMLQLLTYFLWHLYFFVKPLCRVFNPLVAKLTLLKELSIKLKAAMKR